MTGGKGEDGSNDPDEPLPTPQNGLLSSTLRDLRPVYPDKLESSLGFTGGHKTRYQPRSYPEAFFDQCRSHDN